MTNMFAVFSRSIIDQIKFFIETNNKQMNMRESIIKSIRELTNEKEIEEDLLIDRVADRIDDPYIGKPLEELIRANNAILLKNCINEYEREFLIKIRNLISNAYYFYPHLDIDMNALFESDAISFEEAFKAMDEMVETLKEEECCPAREDNTASSEEATVDTSDEIVEEVAEEEPVVEETIEETVVEEELTEQEEFIEEKTEEELTETIPEDDYKRLLPLGFIEFDPSIFELEGRYAFRNDGVVMDLNTNTTIPVSRQNGEYVFFIGRKTIPMNQIRALVHGIGTEAAEEAVSEQPVIEEEPKEEKTTTITCKYIDWVEGIPKTKYRISSRGIFNTVSEAWLRAVLNPNGTESYVLTSTMGKRGERTSKENKHKTISKKKLYEQAGMIPE